MKKNFTVRRGALDGVEMFLAVARHRSFRRAAAELGVTPSAAGQAVRTLETRLGVALFVRTTRNVGMTEAGERFLAGAEPAYQALAAAGAAASDLGGRPAGLLRLAVPRAAVPLIIRPVLASFAAAYPDIELEIAASEEFVDIASQGFDAGMRMGQFIANDMTAVRLTQPFRMVAVASPDYLARRGIPARPEDLQSHACLRLRRTIGGASPWRLIDKGKPLEVIVQGPLIAGDFPHLARCGGRWRRPCASARTGCRRAGPGRNASGRAYRICAADAGSIPLLSRSPAGFAKASCVHRAYEGPAARGGGRERRQALISGRSSVCSNGVKRRLAHQGGAHGGFLRCAAAARPAGSRRRRPRSWVAGRRGA